MAVVAPAQVRAPHLPGEDETRETEKRTDIQGLRAVAVALVVVYHLFPSSVTGGFVGVDVFFVVSGFLITAHLLVRRPTGPRHLLEFWARRIRRLLPASLLVLFVTLVASRLVAPETQWENTARQVAAAAAYVVNWVLARDSVDYLAAAAAASPVQHFWSLSIEEQFYLGWPVLVLVLGQLALATRWAADPRRLRTLFVGGLGLVVVTSLAWSVHLTAVNPPRAYFVTTTRVWELGLGGLVAAAVVLRDRPLRLPAPVAAVIAWVGLAAVLWSGFAYTAATPFPGWQAAVPVVGTAAVLWVAAGTQRWSPGRLLALRPMQWLGDVSYSVYLWHWPLIVLLPEVSGGELGALDKAAIVLATLGLAALTKTYVEDAFRTPQWSRRLGRTYALAAAGMVVVIGTAALQVAEVDGREDDARAALAAALQSADPCFGAGALDAGRVCPPPTGDPVPEPAIAAVDKSDAYNPKAAGDGDCFAYSPRFRSARCVFGDPNGDQTLALVGNSHAGQWLTALEKVARAHHWRVVTYLASRCAVADLRQQFATATQSTRCLDWVRRTTERVRRDRPDLVVFSNRTAVPAEGLSFEDSAAPFAAGYETVLGSWADAGIPVAILRDNPAPFDGDVPSVPDCVAANPDDLDRCSGPRVEWETPDPAVTAARSLDLPGVTVVDLNDHVCGPRKCRAVVGGVVVYFDGSHLSATYNETMAPYLEPELVAALKR